MEKLSMDVAIEIASHVIVAVADLMEDLGNLRATYSQMRWVCGDTIVGRSIPLRRVLLCVIQLGIWNRFYDHEYGAKLIVRLANVSNPGACFYAGMHAIFVEDYITLMPWLDMLEHSAMAGHDVAAFVLSLVLH